MTVIGDAKTGYVDATSSYQLGAYRLCKVYPTREALPDITHGLILRIKESGVEPVVISPQRLQEACDLFLSAFRLYKDGVQHGLIKLKGTDIYPMTLFDAETFYPRVTSILKVLNREALNGWMIRESVKYTLKELTRTKRSPKEVLEAYEQGLFNPQEGALAHRDTRGSEGHDLHRLIRNYLLNLPCDLAAESAWIQVAYPKFEAWATEHHLELIGDLTEKKVYHPDYQYAGTLDFVATVEGLNE